MDDELNGQNVGEEFVEDMFDEELVIEPEEEIPFDEPGDIVPADLDHDSELIDDDVPDLDIDVVDAVGADSGLV